MMNVYVGDEASSRHPREWHQMSPSPAMASTSVDSPYTNQPSNSIVFNQERNMYRESERQKTFNNWRVPFLRGDAMAKAGFYYLNRDDLVRCPFCGVEINKWQEEDDPLVDHKKHSPRCKFILSLPTSGNISIEAENQLSDSSIHSQDSGYDTCGPYDNTPFVNRIEETMSVPTNAKPYFQEYVSSEARLTSFQMWPVSLKIKPKELSEAGFFYTGKGDQTICFFCGGGLKDWEDNDNPWVEHAKWFSKCTFVLLSKGQEFINSVTGKHLPSKTEESSSQAEPSTSEKKEEKVSTEVSPKSITGKESQDDRWLCKVCYTNEMGIVFLPCRHLMACVDCAVNMTKCGVCRKPISSHLRTFLS